MSLCIKNTLDMHNKFTFIFLPSYYLSSPNTIRQSLGEGKTSVHPLVWYFFANCKIFRISTLYNWDIVEGEVYEAGKYFYDSANPLMLKGNQKSNILLLYYYFNMSYKRISDLAEDNLYMCGSYCHVWLSFTDTKYRIKLFVPLYRHGRLFLYLILQSLSRIY